MRACSPLSTQSPLSARLHRGGNTGKRLPIPKYRGSHLELARHLYARRVILTRAPGDQVRRPSYIHPIDATEPRDAVTTERRDRRGAQVPPLPSSRLSSRSRCRVGSSRMETSEARGRDREGRKRSDDVEDIEVADQKLL